MGDDAKSFETINVQHYGPAHVLKNAFAESWDKKWPDIAMIMFNDSKTICNSGTEPFVVLLEP